jgi:hypothetical protein
VEQTPVSTPTAVGVRNHWVWRPEWTPDRTCLYWYFTFREDDITAIVGDDVLRSVGEASWLNAVPPPWYHVTVSDVGFADELEPSDREVVTAAVADALRSEDRLRLTLGPVQPHGSAVVLPAGPLERLRAVKAKVRRATGSVLGGRHADFHRNVYWPHLSVGYANRTVDAETASRWLRTVPPTGAAVDVDALTLAAVTRRGLGYRWQVQAQVALLDHAR